MQTTRITRDPARRSERACLRILAQVAVAAAVVLPGLAMADADAGGEAITTTCGFLSSILSLLNAASIVVVTIAVIFSGYQIAFAHKRISDVAPIMIGSILIGAASQIAKMFLSGSAGSSACSNTAGIWTPAMDHFASAAQLLLQHA
jgi:type IV secretion system protein VirB2